MTNTMNVPGIDVSEDGVTIVFETQDEETRIIIRMTHDAAARLSESLASTLACAKEARVTK